MTSIRNEVATAAASIKAAVTNIIDSSIPLQQQPAIEAVEENSDIDSGYDENALSTASLQSSIYAYEVENGRSYHAYKSGKYFMPNDEGEQERMDIHYHAVRLTIENKHWLCPLEQPTSVLDVGAGTGIWCMDVADDHPGAHIMGIDLSPIQPTYVPPNLEFQVMDADESWDMAARFDFVHTRVMNGVSIRSWDHFYKQAFESLKPGGWVENQEFDFYYMSDDGTLAPDSATLKWQNLWNQGIESIGMTARCHPEKMVEKMQAAGFTNCGIRSYKLPSGVWPKDKRLREAGLFLAVGLSDGIEGLSLRMFTKVLGWGVEEMEALLVDVRKEIKSKSIHSYLPIHVVYGQKPTTAE